MEAGSLSLVTGTRTTCQREGKPRELSSCGECCLGVGSFLTPGTFQLCPDDGRLGRGQGDTHFAGDTILAPEHLPTTVVALAATESSQKPVKNVDSRASFLRHFDSAGLEWGQDVVPRIVRKSNQSILNEINPEYSLEGLMLKLKLQYSGHLIYEELTHWENTLTLQKAEDSRRRGRQDEMVGWHHQLNGHEFEQALGDSEGQGSPACCSPWSHKESDTT